jgi:centrosomal protein CEP19
MSLFSYKSSSSSATSSNFTFTKPTTSNSKENETNGASLFRLNQYDYVPKRFGLRFDPPTIIVEYLVPSSGKLYHHKMKIVGLKESSDSKEVIETLQKKHSAYFTSNKLIDDQLTKLIDRLKKRLPPKKQEKEGATAGFKPTFNAKANGQVDAVKANDKNAKGNSLALTSSLSSTATSKFGVSVKNTNESTNNNNKDGNGFWDVDDDEEDVDYQTANLNKLTPEEVKKHKDKMDVAFKKNQKKPGDPDFVYDKQEEFEPIEDNEWDEEL